METPKFIELIPPILLLTSLMIIILIVLIKFGDKIFNKDYQAETIFIFIAAFLFVTVLITHLFKEQLWTEDALKVIIGVLIGAGATKVSNTKSLKFSNDGEINDSIVNVALRDIKQKIKDFKSEVTNIKEAIVNQYPTIEKKLDEINNLGTIKITSTSTVNINFDDDFFAQKMKLIREQDRNNHLKKWIEESMKFPEINEKIHNEIQNIERDGWKVESMIFDNLPNGLYIRFNLEKPFVSNNY